MLLANVRLLIWNSTTLPKCFLAEFSYFTLPVCSLTSINQSLMAFPSYMISQILCCQLHLSVNKQFCFHARQLRVLLLHLQKDLPEVDFSLSGCLLAGHNPKR